MKASEVIERLQHLVNEYGDRDVTVRDPEYGDTDNVKSIHLEHGEYVVD